MYLEINFLLEFIIKANSALFTFTMELTLKESQLDAFSP